MHLDKVRTALYRLFDCDGKLLYVGITCNVDSRMSSHASAKPWWGHVVRQDVEWFPDRPTALAAEVNAIVSEAPAHNVRDSPWAPKPPPRGPHEFTVTEARADFLNIVARVQESGIPAVLFKNKRRQAGIVPPDILKLIAEVGGVKEARAILTSHPKRFR
jgi:hypothetical protein